MDTAGRVNQGVTAGTVANEEVTVVSAKWMYVKFKIVYRPIACNGVKTHTSGNNM